MQRIRSERRSCTGCTLGLRRHSNPIRTRTTHRHAENRIEMLCRNRRRTLVERSASGTKPSSTVDAYGPEEQAMGWYYYLENKLRFPFQAKCIASKVVSPLRKGEIVEVRRMAPEDSCSNDMLVLIRWQGRNMAVPLSQLAGVDVDESTAEAIGDWHYWVAQGYCF